MNKTLKSYLKQNFNFSIVCSFIKIPEHYEDEDKTIIATWKQVPRYGIEVYYGTELIYTKDNFNTFEQAENKIINKIEQYLKR